MGQLRSTDGHDVVAEVGDGLAFHPGYYLRELMEHGGFDTESLACLLRVPVDALDDVLCGRSDMTLCLAVRLSAAFGMSALYWLNLQCAYDEMRNEGK